VEQPDKNLRPILNKKGRKEAKLKKIVSLLFSPLILGIPRNIIIFPLAQTRKVFFKAQSPSKSEN
jgi:hypothetical protein